MTLAITRFDKAQISVAQHCALCEIIVILRLLLDLPRKCDNALYVIITNFLWYIYLMSVMFHPTKLEWWAVVNRSLMCSLFNRLGSWHGGHSELMWWTERHGNEWGGNNNCQITFVANLGYTIHLRQHTMTQKCQHLVTAAPAICCRGVTVYDYFRQSWWDVM